MPECVRGFATNELDIVSRRIFALDDPFERAKRGLTKGYGTSMYLGGLFGTALSLGDQPAGFGRLEQTGKARELDHVGICLDVLVAGAFDPTALRVREVGRNVTADVLKPVVEDCDCVLHVTFKTAYEVLTRRIVRA